MTEVVETESHCGIVGCGVDRVGHSSDIVDLDKRVLLGGRTVRMRVRMLRVFEGVHPL